MDSKDQMTKKQAYLILNDEIAELELLTEKASLFAEILFDDYFSELPATAELKQKKIIDFKRYSIMSDVLCDYIGMINKIFKELELETENAPH